MAEQKPLTLATLAPVVISLFLGGIIGVEIHKYSTAGQPATPGSSPGSGGMRGSPGGSGGGGGGGGSEPASGRTLARLVGTLNTIETVQGKGLTADQEKRLLPLLQEIKSADKLPEADAKAKLDAVQAVLTPDQAQMIADMTPQRGGRGGGGGGGRGGPGGGPMAMSGGGPMSGGGRGGPMAMSGGGGRPMSGGGPGMAGPGGGGGQRDPDKPFASEPAQKSLDDLIAAVQGGKK